MNHEDQARIKELIAKCKSKPGNWKYSSGFVLATFEMYLIFEREKPLSPMDHLLRAFAESGVQTCRGGAMTKERLQYLYDHHLKSKLKQHYLRTIKL
ncbi:hypothetical protein [Noviherbaspirillum denitrificans]|uniref:Uncharacterized protein n=1 Tax=Noviherbaspirillum denitrificans TaxID=1968433 RepID=A0A254TI91_9BURK|nr:hypothetical protein [Noviherbaspirillum denitrificans]OWW22349.1 hypothetical protein AYR66_25495 [Noviherbaspirillum denitrificans]